MVTIQNVRVWQVCRFFFIGLNNKQVFNSPVLSKINSYLICNGRYVGLSIVESNCCER